jgi:Fe-S-cluster containining protein
VPAISLPVLTLPLRQQRYSCHGCGNCCRDFTVQLREDDLRKLREQNWEEKSGGPVTIEFRGVTYLRQRDDGACVFLMDDGRCRIHNEFGFEAKPIACQLFPFHITPTSRGIVGGLSFACQSVLENKGADLKSHASEVGRMAGALGELQKGRAAGPPMLTDRLRASQKEEESLVQHIDDWLGGGSDADIDLSRRIDGLAWIAQSLARANLDNVRETRFDDLLDVLFAALPDELEHHPIEPATARQKKMLRQAVFARTEDPKLGIIARQGRLRTTLGQLSRNRRFKSARGMSPHIGQGWNIVELREVETIAPASDANEVEAIDDLMTRWLRATVLGSRAWGMGYYGWSMINGLQTIMLNIACVGWLARLHAAGEGRRTLAVQDVRAAIGRIDRTAGRAKWLGSSAERLRLGFLNMDDGLRRLIAGYVMTQGP